MRSAIEIWLEEFRNSWPNHDIDAIMELFTNDVEYWETPFKKLGSREELKTEWRAVANQRDIKLETNLFSSRGDKHSVIWRLKYDDDTGSRELAGTYLIVLNHEGICAYFHHTGELLSRE